MNKIQNLTDDARALSALAIICLAAFLPICFFTPSYYADDGGYIRMLSYFVQFGKVDLMHWSQPTAIGLLLVGALAVKLIGFGFTQLDLVGLSFSIAAICGVYTLLRFQLAPCLSFLLALSIFCFNEIVLVTPTFMTDIPFLAYCVWWFVFTNRILVRAAKADIRDYLAWCLLLLFALLTRSTGLMALPALLVAAVFCQPQRKRLLTMIAMFCLCWLIASLVTRMVAINPLSFFQTTALREIIQLHDFARFNIRAAALAMLSVIFAASPLLMAVKPGNKEMRPFQICCAIVASIASIYFSCKGFFQPLDKLLSPLVILCITVASFNLPTIAAAAVRTNKALSLILLTFMVVCLGVLPIMAHPLTRHAIPAMVALTVLIGIANCWRPHAEKFVFVVASLLLFNNIIVLQKVRMVDMASMILAQALVKTGVPSKDVDAGWAWFCYEALVPGAQEPTSYVERFGEWQKQAKYSIGSSSAVQKDGPVLTHVEAQHYALKIDVAVAQRKVID